MREELFIYESLKKNSGTTWALFLLVGWSYGSFGQMGKQVAYYLTLGGFGLWALYVLFTLNNKIRNYNRKVAVDVGLSAADLQNLRLV